jgi:hypothetical protein
MTQLIWKFNQQELDSLVPMLEKEGFSCVSFEHEKTLTGRSNDLIFVYKGFYIPVWRFLSNLEGKLELLSRNSLFLALSSLVIDNATQEQRLTVLLEEILTWLKTENTFRDVAKKLIL